MFGIISSSVCAELRSDANCSHLPGPHILATAQRETETNLSENCQSKAYPSKHSLNMRTAMNEHFQKQPIMVRSLPRSHRPDTRQNLVSCEWRNIAERSLAFRNSLCFPTSQKCCHKFPHLLKKLSAGSGVLAFSTLLPGIMLLRCVPCKK